MNPIKYLIYQFLKLLTKISFRVYYPNATRIGLQHLRYRGGSILASNHPNTLLDPLNAACRVPKVVHFLANASLFQTPFTNWFFNTFYCIPVERPQDTKGKPINNKGAFAKSQRFISEGGCLYIAPEGGSDMERRVRPFKTGTARIALGAAANAGFDTELRILPVGLTYDSAPSFRSRMTVCAAPPILLRDYKSLYEESPKAAAKQLTEDLEQAVRNCTVDTRGPEEDALVLLAEEMLRNSGPLNGEAHFYRTKQWIANFRAWEEQAPEASAAFARAAEAYRLALKQARTTDQAVVGPPTAGKWVKAALGAPLALYGALNNFFPAYLPKLATDKAKLYVGYTATVRVLAGLLTFPLFYALQAWAVAAWIGSAWALPYLISLPLSGWAVLSWHQAFSEVQAARRLKLSKQAPPLKAQRQALLDAILPLARQQQATV